MAQIKWTNHATLDLKDIFDYIAKDSKSYAFHHVQKIKEKTFILRNNPRLGRKVPEMDRDDIRELIQGDYRIIFRIKTEKRIDIISVFHSARILRIDDRV
jgi:addiction module RelE/StbE family toxin